MVSSFSSSFPSSFSFFPSSSFSSSSYSSSPPLPLPSSSPPPPSHPSPLSRPSPPTHPPPHLPTPPPPPPTPPPPVSSFLAVQSLAYLSQYTQSSFLGTGPMVEACTVSNPITLVLPPPVHEPFFKMPRNDSGQSHPQRTFSGPALTVMSFDVEGLSAAKQQLVADLSSKHQCAVICMQETHRAPNDIRPNVPGMDLAIERHRAQYDSAIFVTSSTIVNATSPTEVNNIEILRVDLRGISVTSVYKPPGGRLSFHQPPTAIGDQLQVIIGDFNSHSSTWGYATTNTDGELVEYWAENQILSLIHDPSFPALSKAVDGGEGTTLT